MTNWLGARPRMKYTEADEDDWLAAWHQGFARSELRVVLFQWGPRRFFGPGSFAYSLPEAPDHTWYVGTLPSGDLWQHDCETCRFAPRVTGSTGTWCPHKRPFDRFDADAIGDAADLGFPAQDGSVDVYVDTWLNAITAAARRYLTT